MDVHPMSIQFDVYASHPLQLRPLAVEYLNELLGDALDDKMMEVELTAPEPAYVEEQMVADDKVRPSVWGQQFIAKWTNPVEDMSYLHRTGLVTKDGLDRPQELR